MTYLQNNMEILTWQKVRAEFRLVNNELAGLIDALDPGESYKFIKIRYKFGQSIVNMGRLHVPISESETAGLEDAGLDSLLKNELNYNILPMWMNINKKSEVFYENHQRVMPTKIISPGVVLGLWEAFDPRPDVHTEGLWNVTAGVRSLFMLPKVSDQIAHKRINKALNISSHIPVSMLDQFQIFKEISLKNNSGEGWYVDVLFFGKKWFALNHKESLEICKIKYYFLEQAWKQSYNCRNNMAYDLAKEIFTKAVSEKRIKPKPILLNTLKHLLAVSDGFYPGYGPALDNMGAPVEVIRSAYVDNYKIQLDPTVMEPFHLSLSDRPVYYSLQLPSLLENAPSVHGKNIIIDLRELSMLMDILNSTLPKHKSQFTFYHPHCDAAYNIQSVNSIFDEDANFIKQSGGGVDQVFAKNSPFLKGCVQIKLLENCVLPLPIL
jgi:hypothetical protein